MKVLALLLAFVVGLVSAFPYAFPDEGYAPKPYHKPDVGRVKIQVYRGPSKGKGYDSFAPWGYYNTQPIDDAYKSHY